MSTQGKKNLKARIKKSVENCKRYGCSLLANAISPVKNHEVHRRLAKKINFNKLGS